MMNLDEVEDAWQLYSKYSSSYMDDGVIICVHCGKTLIVEEISMHLRIYHVREAIETLKLILEIKN